MRAKNKLAIIISLFGKNALMKIFQLFDKVVY